MKSPAAEPRASLILPVWRDAATVGEAIADVRAQRGGDWDCVTVLDGADAASREAARAAIGGDERFVVLDLPHQGLPGALNAAIDAARGEILMRFDADDRMSPERISRQLAYLDAHPEVDVLSTHVRWATLDPSHDGRGMHRHVAWLNTLTTHEALSGARFIDAPLAHPTVAMRRSALPCPEVYRDGPFAEDHDLWLRLFAAGRRFAVLPEPLVTWRDRGARLTRSDARYRDEARRALVHRHLLDGPLAASRPVRIWGAGRYGRRHARGLLAAARARGTPLTLTAFLDIDPAKIGRRLQGGIPVLSADDLGPPDGALTLVAVASPGARAIIEGKLAARGHARERDYLLLQ